MQATNSMAKRISDLLGNDSVPQAAAKIQLAGGKVTVQGIHKWLNGGQISEPNLLALAAAYGSTPAYIRYGVQEKPLSESQQAAADLVGEEPDMAQEAFDFMSYRINRSVADNPDKLRRYMEMIEKISKAGKQ